MINLHNKIMKRGDISMRKIIANWTQTAGRTAKIAAPMLILALFLGAALIGGLTLPDTVNASGTITSCANCHGNPPVDSATRDNATGQFPGNHSTHAGAWYTTTDSRYGFNCEICHVAPNYGITSFSHQNDNVTVVLRWGSMAGAVWTSGSVAGWGSYSRGTNFPLSNQTTVNQVCTNTYCHSAGTGGTTQTGDVRPIAVNISPMWGTNTPGGPGCTPCHGKETGNPGNGAPWYTSGWQMATKNWVSFKANSHQSHAGSGNPCNKCHYSTTNTGNTITSVGNHIKRSYTITNAPGISYTYAYSTTGGTCTTIACHGGGSMKWGTGTADCVSCHGAAITKSLGIGTIRRVIGGDFPATWTTPTTGTRHLFGATTIVKWDCIVCHREGSITNGKASATYHNDGVATTGGLVHLRNMDTTNEAIGWAIDNKRWTTTDYTSLDNFCVSCHDADGASQVAVNNTNNGLYTGVAAWNTMRTGTIRAALAPFNSTDTANGHIKGSTMSVNAGPRMRVVNVKDQFYAGTPGAVGAAYNGNPSQHAVFGQRYSTIWTSWTAAAWSSYTMKKQRANINVTRETSLLSCADCHILDSGNGAHSGTTQYNMQGSNAPVTFCAKCHASGVYVGVANTASRFQHNTDSGNIGSSSTGYGLPAGNYQCMMCHASWNNVTTVARNASYGGIHGSWSSTANYPWVTAGVTITAYRFNPGGWRASGPMDWTSARASCYFKAGAADAFSSCTSHSSATGRVVTTAANYIRPVKY